MIYSTSGSTGARKYFDLSEEQLSARVETLATCRPQGFSEIKSIAVARSKHDTTSSARYDKWMADKGGKFIPLTGTVDEMAQAIIDQKPEALVAGGALLTMFSSRVQTRHIPRFIICGGIGLHPEYSRAIRSGLGDGLWNTYSASEVGTISLAHAFEVERQRGYCGRPCQGVQARVVLGRIQVKTPTMISAYTDPKLTQKYLPDGWFATGDKGYIKDGSIVLGQQEN